MQNYVMEQLVEHSLAESFLLSNQLDSAVKYNQMAYNNMISHNGKNEEAHPFILFTFGNIYSRKSNTQLALHNYFECIKYMSNYYGNFHAAAAVSRPYLFIAQIYKQLNKQDSAIYFANKSLEMGVKSSTYDNIEKTSTFLAELYQNKDSKKAAQYYDLALSSKDSLYSIAQRNIFKNVTEFDQKERQYEISQTENQYKQYGLIAGLGTMILIGFILYHNNQKEKKAKNQLQEKNHNI